MVYLEQAGLGLPDESYYREDAARRQAHGLRRARRADAVARRLARPRGRRRSGHGPRDPARRRALGQGDQPRPGQDLHPGRPRRSGRDGPRRRLGALPRGAGRHRGRPSRPSSSASPTTCARWPPPWRRSRSRCGATGSPGTSCTRTRPTCRPPSSRRTSTSTAAPCRACRRCASAGSAASAWSRRRSARPWASSTSSGTSRRTPRSAWSSSSTTSSRPSGAACPQVPWMGDDTRREALDQARPVHPEDRLPGALARLLGARDRPRRPARQRPPGGGLRGRPPAGQARRAGRPRRVVHDPADGQRLLQPGPERDRLPRRDPAAPVLRRRRRRRGQLRRHRRGHRARGRPRLRRPGLAVRRHRHAAQLVDRRGPRGLPGPRRRPHRPVRRARDPRRPRPQGQRRAHRRREHRRPRRAHHRLLGLPHLARRPAGPRDRRPHRRAAVLPRLGAGLARAVPPGRGRAAARPRPAQPDGPARQRRPQPHRVPRGLRGDARATACGWRPTTGSASSDPAVREPDADRAGSAVVPSPVWAPVGRLRG